MHPSIIRAIGVPLRGGGGDSQPRIIVPALPVAQRVVLTKETGSAYDIADDPNNLRDGSTDNFEFSLNGPETTTLIAAPGQTLWALRTTAGGAQLSVHSADAQNIIYGARALTPSRVRNFSISVVGQVTPTPIAQAPGDAPLRVLLRNRGAGATLFLALDPNELVSGSMTSAFRMLPGTIVFMLAPGQKLFANSSLLAPHPLTIEENRGALYSDVHFVQ